MADAVRDGFIKAHDLYRKYTGRKLSNDEWAALIQETGEIGDEAFKHRAGVVPKVLIAVLDRLEDENMSHEELAKKYATRLGDGEDNRRLIKCLEELLKEREI